VFYCDIFFSFKCIFGFFSPDAGNINIVMYLVCLFVVLTDVRVS